MRIAGLIDGQHVRTPRRVLATTFTNRAKDNLRSRLNDHIASARMRDHVTVSNYHGLAARIIRAHGNVVGIDPTIECLRTTGSVNSSVDSVCSTRPRMPS